MPKNSAPASSPPAAVGDPGANAVRELASGLRLDPTSSRPLYRQVQDHLEDLLRRGRLAAGAGLPAERVLADTLGISRTVVKRAYSALREQGVLDSHGRGGTEVRRDLGIQPELGQLRGFTQEMRSLGLVPGSRLEALDIVKDRTIASLFGRPSSTRFVRAVRVRLGNDLPMTRETAWYDLTVAPEMAHWSGEGSAYDFLRQRCGLTLAWAEQSMEAVLSAEPEMRVFDFARPQPCLLLKRRSYTAQDMMVEYVEGVFRGDAYSYRLRLKV